MLIWAGALLGAIIGSFIATIVVRWPQGRSAMRGRSACDGCGAPVAAIGLVPVLSHVAQRGRARCCGAPIDRIHIGAELLAMAIGASAGAVADTPIMALAGATFGWLLLTLALFDARHFWLPDRVTATLASTGLAFGLAGVAPDLATRLIGGAAALLVFLAVRHGYRLARGREGMGGGDVKLFAAIGLWLGWRLLPIVLLGAALLGLAWVLVLIRRGRPLTGTSSVPFGAFLAVAAWAIWLFAPLAT